MAAIFSSFPETPHSESDPKAADVIEPMTGRLLPQSSIDRMGPCGYDWMMLRFVTLALLLSALLVPRAAWAEHLGQHGQSLASSEDHVHHNDHVHTDASPDNENDHGSGFAHNHLPADVLSVGAEPGSAPVLKERLMLAERRSATPLADRAPESPPNNLLRPPRTL